MMRWLAIFVVCLGVVGVLLGLSAPTYERTETALSMINANDTAIVDDFSNISMMFTVVRYRLLMDPSTDSIEVVPSVTNNKVGWLVYWIHYDENSSVTIEQENFVFSSIEARTEAYNLSRYAIEIPQYELSSFWGDLGNVLMNILVVITTLFSFVGAFVFVLVDIISITFSLVRGILYLVGFPV